MVRLGHSEQINRPCGTGPRFSCFQALRARLLWGLSSYLSTFYRSFSYFWATQSRLIGVYKEQCKSTFASGSCPRGNERIGTKRKKQNPSQRREKSGQGRNGINRGDPSGRRMGSRLFMPDPTLTWLFSALSR